MMDPAISQSDRDKEEIQDNQPDLADWQVSLPSATVSPVHSLGQVVQVIIS